MPKRRFALTIKAPSGADFTFRSDASQEVVEARAREMMRSFLRAGIQVSLYDSTSGIVIFDDRVRGRING